MKKRAPAPKPSGPRERAEVKVSLDRSQVEAARQRLALSADPAVGLVAFFEDLTVGTRLPLLGAGVVLRVRSHMSKRLRTTVKLRPGRRSQLTARWLEPAAEVRLEQDWGLGEPVLAAALDGRARSAAIEPEAFDSAAVAALFGSAQLEFLADCAPLRINPGELSLLGPVRTEKWEAVVLPGADGLAVDVERWTIDQLDFIELSTKLDDTGRAGAVQAQLVEAVSAFGLTFGQADRTKTELVLTHLASRP